MRRAASRVDLVVLVDGKEHSFQLRRPRRPRRANPPEGILARFGRARWEPLTDGKRGALRAWNPKLVEFASSSGVYVLRDRSTKSVIYVGESHTGRLYRTLLRHFHDSSGKFAALQEWVHHAPGRLEVLVFETPASEALEAEQEAIMYYEPLINKVGASSEDSDAPF